MLKDTISRAAFIAVVIAASPALADEAALVKMINDLGKQVQDQQKQIDRLEGELSEKRQSQKSAAVQGSSKQAAEHKKPGVVAPLEPTPLGTLRMSEILHPETLVVVSQEQTQVAQTAAPSSATQQPPPVSAAASVPASSGDAAPAHVGAAPPSSDKPPEVPAHADVGGVLTPFGNVVLEPFVQYSRSSVNTFAFQGVQVIPAFLIGTVAADRTSRDLVTSGATARVGVSDRLELETRVPFVWRQDAFTNTIPNVSNQTSTTTTNGYGLGDVEFAAHYQINNGQEDWPFFIGNLRYKSDTGSSPYDVPYNADGSARRLATGSGFNAVEPSMTFIYPSDPAILFANLGYIHSFEEDINHTVAGNAIGNVAPGDTYVASVGMGVALNDRLSFTLGYEHDYVRPTATVIGGAKQYSDSLQVGSALSGISFKVNDRTSINLNLAAGVTRDAPDTVITLRVPISFQAF
jgi:hypothetical protein